MQRNQRRFEGPGAKSKRRTCKLCGRQLSMYNDTGACHSHRCAPDSNREWEPPDRAESRIKIMEASDVPISQQEQMICSPGPFAMKFHLAALLLVLWFVPGVLAASPQPQQETACSFKLANGCFEAVEHIRVAHQWWQHAYLQACDGVVVREWYSEDMDGNDIRVWYLQARRIYYIKTHQQLRRTR